MWMCSSRMLIFVKRFNNKGFTFVEMMLAFSVFLVIVAFIPLSLRIFYHGGLLEPKLQTLEWEVFANQVKKEIRMSDGLSVTNNKLDLIKDGQSIVYERYGSNIRRRVDLQGHEIVLQNVKTVTFEPMVNGVKISVEDSFNQKQSTVIRTLINEEGLYAQ